ncbi:serine--tRNA ligase [Acidaminobacterium chupaoyuni]
MLDIRMIREDTQHIKERLAARGKNYDADIDRALELDDRRRALIAESEQMKAEQNRVSKQVPMLKKQGQDVSDLLAEMKELAEKGKEYAAQLAEIENEQRDLLLRIPNVPCDLVPVGESSDDNVEVRRWGEPRAFDFEIQPHWDLGEKLDILDMPRATKVAGTRFAFMKGDGARLERAVISYCLDQNKDDGFTELLTPYMANTQTLTGTGQLPKFAEDMFHVEGTDYCLISTAEIPVTNYHAGEILDGAKLPLYYTAFTPCFRSEAGSAGRDTRGLIRVHQFHKVEVVKFVKPEDSPAELESLTRHAERLLQGLGLPYRVVLVCTEDMGANQIMQYDIEVWMPSYGRYVEISSCSNYSDYQARRAGIRFKREKDAKAELVHTLNGSSLPAGRTVAAIMENYQNADGTITIPEVLRPYLRGQETIE